MAGTFSSHWWPEEEPIYEPDMLRSEVSLEQELAGLCVLKAISRPDSGMQPLGDLDSDGRGTNVSALRVALSLAQDPTTTLHLSEPRIIYGCIKLLKTIKSQRGTIFDELGPGWLCFRLLVIALDTCLLERFDKLEETLALPNQRPNIRAAPHILVSAHLAHGIYSRFDDITAGRCDWVFGWSISPYKPLLSASEALDLMNIIWEDRKLFLRVIYSCVATSRPGLSGLMFLFLRSIAHMKLQPNTNMRIPGARFCELVIRYLLVADKHQRVPMILMCDTETEAFISIGTHIPRHVDPEDSRVISTAFIRQLTAGDDPDILRRREPCTMLRLVPLAIDIKAQSLIPDVVGCIIEYGWFALPTIHEQSNKEPWGVIAIIFEALR
ncbi:unnamed protein product [Rhizoctonia solani]|uniref:Uncharacterized protein n=1 Tax=Rhizoctonia solani TaxID=456999 RepID=A0A8H3E0C2_9AGAM|nr:unnamed protein product [Rhizoctonia solani]